MSSSLRLPTDQTDQRRRRNGDNGYRDQTGSQNVSETIHQINPTVLEYTATRSWEETTITF